MRALGRGAFTALALLIAATACRDTPTALGPATPAPRASEGALTGRGTYDWPANGIPISAPCLGLGELLYTEGTWHVHWEANLTKLGQYKEVDHVDYSDVVIHADGLTWTAAPGAIEQMVFLYSGSVPTAQVERHQFDARYLSQDGLPDLLVRHSVKVVVGPDGTFRHYYFGVPFDAKCIGA